MNPKSRIIIAGGSGFLGTRLTAALAARSLDAVILTRIPGHSRPGVKQLAWDGRTVDGWAKELDGAVAVVNLTGRSVNCRHTEANRRAILESRVHSVKVLAQAVWQCGNPPPVWVQAGSLAIYGDPGDRWCAEDAPHGNDFSTQVCETWEETFFETELPAIRKVVLRIGLVLDRGRGALGVLETLTRWFLGGSAGSGRQYISWLHWQDFNALVLDCIQRPELAGIFNACTQQPVTNAEFMSQLRRVVGRPWSPPAPAVAVKLGAFFMGTEGHLALTGRRCLPGRLLEHGFHFQYPELPAAFDELYRK